MSNFDDIRPYNDAEVLPTIQKLLAEPELLSAVASLKFPEASKRFPKLLAMLAKGFLSWELRGVNTVADWQIVLERYLKKNLDATTAGISFSGLENLDRNGPYLFVSNHRDIAMDPACINWVLHHNGFSTLRIAIGDNLLSKQYVSDLMRLNKTFIVNRSAKSPKEKLKAAKHLSAYIYHSLTQDKSNIWIAQREGRAKDGRDITNRAIISMFGLNKPKQESFSDYIAELRIVPVAISYEWDPCDTAKANELHHLQTVGEYAKQQHEDVESIAKGIAGFKGHVHMAFGEVLGTGFNDAEAVALEIERQIHANYVLHASNLAAYQQLYKQVPEALTFGVEGTHFHADEQEAAVAELLRRVNSVPDQHKTILLAGYANPVLSKLAHLDALGVANATQTQA
ncbi:1-acyl-sn-glycerol-3-phosphate acyltransferase [Halioxenophilus sp. WMMB6]|uniref:1-acyl-sn-glycerol-3-phosphate acyltransferase n=1 Tax=Halioxenophilus sp. WMMB6 TaxID=3073815 RepID=UPI00295E999E|nr:1-acyl-sn-glycerol-3-phosphate acyltransferase [Halioxenophilus sp. WMMB6]